MNDDTKESLFEAPPLAEQERMVEAILFASAEPVSVAALNARMPHGADAAEALVLLRKRYEGRGVNVVKVGDAWAIRTAPDPRHAAELIMGDIERGLADRGAR